MSVDAANLRFMPRNSNSLFWWVALLLFVGLPAVFFIWGLLWFYGAFFWDGTVYRCGIEAMLATGFPYRYVGECVGYGLPFTSPPGITRVLSHAASAIGPIPLAALYVFIYLSGVLGLLWSAQRVGAGKVESAIFLLTISCGIFVSEVASGNIGVAFIGMFCAAALLADRHPYWPVILCALIIPFKAHYAIYLLVPLLINRNYLAVAAAGCVASLWFVADVMLDVDTFRYWLGVVATHADEVPGFGFMMLMHWLGLGQAGWVQAIGFGCWSALLLGLAWRISSQMASPADRAMVALLCVTLIQPRLKEYDCLVLIPLFFWLSGRLADFGRRWLWRLVLIVGFCLPSFWWWARKILLVQEEAPLTLSGLIDMKWLVQTQGFFLTAMLLLLVAFLIWDQVRPRTKLSVPGRSALRSAWPPR